MDTNSGQSSAEAAWETVEVRIETQRFGPFQFQPGVDSASLVLPLQRVQDAHERFRRSGLSQVAVELEREVLASSIFGTNTCPREQGVPFNPLPIIGIFPRILSVKVT